MWCAAASLPTFFLSMLSPPINDGGGDDDDSLAPRTKFATQEFSRVVVAPSLPLSLSLCDTIVSTAAVISQQALP